MFQSDARLLAYEYRGGQPKSSLATTNPTFFLEVAGYILKNNLARLVALEVLDAGHQQSE